MIGEMMSSAQIVAISTWLAFVTYIFCVVVTANIMITRIRERPFQPVMFAFALIAFLLSSWFLYGYTRILFFEPVVPELFFRFGAVVFGMLTTSMLMHVSNYQDKTRVDQKLVEENKLLKEIIMYREKVE